MPKGTKTQQSALSPGLELEVTALGTSAKRMNNGRRESRATSPWKPQEEPCGRFGTQRAASSDWLLRPPPTSSRLLCACDPASGRRKAAERKQVAPLPLTCPLFPHSHASLCRGADAAVRGVSAGLAPW